MNLRQAAQQALEAICGAKLCEVNSMSSRVEMLRLMDSAITALRAALAEPEQEPVIWADLNKDGEVIRFRYHSDGNPHEVALYDAPTA